MKNRSNDLITRREFFSLSLAAAAAVPALSILRSTPVWAQDLPHVDPATDPVAMALGYQHEVSAVDATKFPKVKEAGEQHCGNCMLYEGKDAEWGGCSMFPGNTTGWCNAWAPKPA